jgi:hypothetical protein
MSIKLSVLKSGDNVIADIKEIISDDNIVVGYLFCDPQKVECQKRFVLTEDISNSTGEVQITLSPWIILSDDKNIPVRPDWVVTMVEPVSILKEMYEEKVNGKLETVSFTE